ncbi:MAG TPA: M3 family metallopeptidase, partial [Thermoanaerobaculia bacterium]
MLVVGFASAGSAQYADRASTPDRFRFDLASLYPSDEAWRGAKEKLEAQIPAIATYKGTLGRSPQQLLAALDDLSTINKEYARLFIYSSLNSDVDTRVAKYQATNQEMQKMGTAIASQSAYFEPEILRIDQSKIDAFIQQEPKLAVYRQYLDDILRRQPHTLSEGEEKIIADAGLMSAAPSDVYGIFADADFPYPSVTLSDGKTVRLDKSAFGRYRAVPNRDDRRKVMEAFFDSLGKYKATFGATFNGQVSRDLFYARARHYNSSVEASLDQSNIPVSVYTSLVSGVNNNIDAFHRYLRLRKRMMGVD